MLIDLSATSTQAQVAAIVGISQQAVSALVAEGKLPAEGTVREVVHVYCQRLREQAAGRMSEENRQLSIERAMLAREQREGIAIKNATLRGEFASVALLSEVLAMASQSVAERFDHLPAELKRSCPNLPEAAREQVLATIASARSTWVGATVALVRSAIVTPADDAEESLDLDDEPRAD